MKEQTPPHWRCGGVGYGAPASGWGAMGPPEAQGRTSAPGECRARQFNSPVTNACSAASHSPRERPLRSAALGALPVFCPRHLRVLRVALGPKEVEQLALLVEGGLGIVEQLVLEARRLADALLQLELQIVVGTPDVERFEFAVDRVAEREHARTRVTQLLRDD